MSPLRALMSPLLSLLLWLLRLPPRGWKGPERKRTEEGERASSFLWRSLLLLLMMLPPLLPEER